MRGLHVARRGREWSPLLLLALVLCGGFAWGLATAFATTSPPSPSSGNVVLRLGWTEEPDNLNVFIGYQDTSYEIWALNYDTLSKPATVTSRPSTWSISGRPQRTAASRTAARFGRCISEAASDSTTARR